MDEYIGKMLDDRYEILDVLGVGGMAVVYKAKCHRLNRLVAVKMLKPELAEDEEIRSRFHDESQAVAMMSHPNIVNVYDANQTDGIEYIAMELIEGITLKQYMKKRGSALNWREALHFSTQIFQALKHAHSRGIVHRDIKPQNIMVLRDGSVKVADFGIARISDSQRTMTSETLGSVHYISPEQAKGGDIDGRSDLYSAGVVLYEMLTGRLPYEGDSAISVALQHINSIPLSPRELVEDIPVGMEQITMKCMAPNRDLRYNNAEAVLVDLEAFRKNPDIVFPYENPWIPGDNDTTMLHLPVAAEAGAVAAGAAAGAAEPAGTDALPDGAADEEADAEEDSTKTKRLAIVLGTIAVILLVIALLFFLVWQNLLSGMVGATDTYEVPSLLGMTQVEAEEYLLEDEECSGHFTLTVSEETVYDANYEIGQIVSQTPTGGTTSKSEVTEIIVTLCAEEEEEETMEMPNIIGENYKEWAAKLEEEYNVIVKYDARNSDDYEEDCIISTDPEAGESLTAGQSVMLYYSKGPAVKQVTMISLEGMTLEKAEAKLTELGLTVGEVVTVDSDLAEGTVVYQSIATNTDVNVGTAVNLQVSAGPKATEAEEELVTEAPETEDETETETETETEETPQQDDTQQEDTAGADTTDSDAESNDDSANADNADTTGDADGDTTDEGDSQEETLHYVVINMPEGRTEDSYLVVTVNGSVLYEGSIEAENGKVTLTISGTVETVSVTLDGQDYTDFTVA
ncbi:MAG: Stk1 family PASTA domain-containing Ser/Thr kinase [Clostridiales bacterium]|nr:Stk1 family PASTA domain-containing Ser/Thr kinase [Clostridiales bacterium]